MVLGQWVQGVVVPSAHLVSLTIYIELEGNMIPQNTTLDKADHLEPKNVLG